MTDANDRPDPEQVLADRSDLWELIVRARDAARADARRGIPPAVARVDTPSDLAQSVAREILVDATHLEFRGLPEFEAMARKILRRKVIEKLRRWHTKQRDVRREEKTGGDAGETAAAGHEPAAAGPSPSEAVSLDELGGQLAALLDSLPIRERQVLELRMQGRTHDQIAAALGISRTNSEKLLSRARARIDAGLRRSRGLSRASSRPSCATGGSPSRAGRCTTRSTSRGQPRFMPCPWSAHTGAPTRPRVD